MENAAQGSETAGGARPALWAAFGSRAVAYAWAILYLLPLGLVFDLAGYVPLHGRAAALAVLLALPCLLRPSRRAWEAIAGLALVLAAQALRRWPPLAETCLWLLAHQWVWTRIAPEARPPGAPGGVLAFLGLWLVLFLSPQGYSLAETLNRLLGASTGWVAGTEFHLGPTYQGLGALLLFLCLSLFAWTREPASKARTACWLAAALVIHAFLALLLIRKANFGADFTWQLKYREPFGFRELWGHLKALALLVYPGFLFLADLAAYLILHPPDQKDEAAPEQAAPESAGPRPPQRALQAKALLWRAGPIAGAAAALLLLACPPTAWRRPAPREILFVERGVVSFSKPDYTRFGRAAGGMYGLLPEYARLFGWKGRVVKQVPEKLDPERQAVMFTNLDEPLPEATRERVWEFVKQGGRLWVLGDHTFIKNGRNHINDLLAPCHIRLRHDSAQFFPQGWFHSYRLRQGTPFGLLRDPAENRLALLVGASLEVRAPAVPFILGRFGYSDLGVETPDPQRGYLGDFEYQPEERLGDLVLVAGEIYGKGRVLVFGDTTSFFNHNLSRSYELLRSVLSWLGEPNRGAWLYGTAGRLLTAAAALALCALAWRLRRKGAEALGAAALCLALGAAWAHRESGLLQWDETRARQRVALIDFSHHPEASKHSSMGSGLHGLTINLMRYGLLPLAPDRWDKALLNRSRLLVLNAPRRVLSRREVGQIGRYLEQGGTVWLTCGYPHEAFSRKLLARYRLRVEATPLGRFFDRPAFGQPVSFFSAWPIRVENPDASLICVYGDWPLMVLVPTGKGRLVAIGDSEFFQNRNLESLERYDPANIRFVRALLSYTVGTVPP